MGYGWGCFALLFGICGLGATPAATQDIQLTLKGHSGPEHDFVPGAVTAFAHPGFIQGATLDTGRLGLCGSDGGHAP